MKDWPRIVLIGFSGTGKTHWSARLQKEQGYQHICCDDLLEEELENLLPDGTRGMARVGGWMGQPWEKNFEERQAKLLAAEATVMRRILSSSGLPDKKVIDTTGSVIYAEDTILQRLRRFGTVVHLGLPDEVVDEMFTRFSVGDRALVWGDIFSRLKGETRERAVARCYRELLFYRRRRYDRWAQVTLDYKQLRSPGFGTRDFLSEIRSGGTQRPTA